MHEPNDSTEQHQDLTMLLPWYVNGTLPEHDRPRLERHLSGCAPCRDDLAFERELHRRLSDERPVEYLPAPSLKRLQRALDALEPGAAAADIQERRGRAPLRRYAVAAGVLMSALVGWLMVERWHTSLEPAYHTVTQSPARPAEEVVRAVFSPEVTLVELQSILAESGLKIISGPSEAGVYSLAATSTRPVAASLTALRRHPQVRFAEATRLDPTISAQGSSQPN